jgi:hypothetical protein
MARSRTTRRGSGNGRVNADEADRAAAAAAECLPVMPDVSIVKAMVAAPTAPKAQHHQCAISIRQPTNQAKQCAKQCNNH